mmetsp:Transcript_20108/g.55537  ORF Transcript_20108/g.55537 Transcript_20108/m.55537 type:complete len:89 (+) Transcript_20108:26-292(+)
MEPKNTYASEEKWQQHRIARNPEDEMHDDNRSTAAMLTSQTTPSSSTLGKNDKILARRLLNRHGPSFQGQILLLRGPNVPIDCQRAIS